MRLPHLTIWRKERNGKKNKEKLNTKKREKKIIMNETETFERIDY